MKLNKLVIENYKSIKNFDLKFNGQNTIIFGVNGTGKSTILSAINFLTRIWINKINGKQNKEKDNFFDSDISIAENSLDKYHLKEKF